MRTPSAPDQTPTNPVCAIVRASFEDYRSEALPAPQRRMLREHLRGCDACRAAAAAEDPTFRFARSLNETVSEGESREILSAVMTGVDLLRTERRIRGPRPSRRLRIGSAAAAAVAAAVLVSTGWGILQSPAMPTAGGVPVPASTAMISAQPTSSSAHTDVTALQPAAMSEDAPAPSPDAIVYDWNPGAGREEPRVVWIVDRGLDI
ncbi:MAG TPA: zf-HC2 domain-containing protein [Thermoanaerobaculia bacterium]